MNLISHTFKVFHDEDDGTQENKKNFLILFFPTGQKKNEIGKEDSKMRETSLERVEIHQIATRGQNLNNNMFKER